VGRLALRVERTDVVAAAAVEIIRPSISAVAVAELLIGMVARVILFQPQAQSNHQTDKAENYKYNNARNDSTLDFRPVFRLHLFMVSAL